jgi:hypothetical protein
VAFYPLQKPETDFPQVTYPYIMAKVRIQAGSAGSMDDSEQTEKRSQTLHANRKHPGALKVLMAVWKHEGILGWYQVCACIGSISYATGD